MPPTFTHGRTRSQFGATSLDATAAQSRKLQMPAAQTLPSVAPQPPSWLPPGAGSPGAPQVAPVAQPFTDVQQGRTWWAGDNSNDGLIFRDRHVMASRGTEVAGRISSMPDPPKDGPLRPDFRQINRTWNWQAGTGSAYVDDLSRPYTWIGEQDGQGWSRINGGQPGFYRNGPGGAPCTADAPGPGRVPTGPPHGLHTLYPPDGQQTLNRFRATPQMVAARVDRLSNSRVNGQTYSERTLHQGEAPSFRGRR